MAGNPMDPVGQYQYTQMQSVKGKKEPIKNASVTHSGHPEFFEQVTQQKIHASDVYPDSAWGRTDSAHYVAPVAYTQQTEMTGQSSTYLPQTSYSTLFEPNGSTYLMSPRDLIEQEEQQVAHNGRKIGPALLYQYQLGNIAAGMNATNNSWLRPATAEHNDLFGYGDDQILPPA